MADSSATFNKKYERIVEEIFDELVPGNECNIDCYSKHAKHYEEGIAGLKFDIPWRCAEMSLKYVETGSVEMQVLDICVGTGLSSKALVDRGYKGSIDGIDGCQEMLDEAKKKGFFRNLVHDIIIPGKKLPFADDTYDIIVCTGSFSPGHLRPECLPEIFRIIKPGGTFSFNTTNFNRDDAAANDVDLNRADTVMDDLEKRGVCKLMECVAAKSFTVSKEFKYYKGNEDKVRCYRKSKPTSSN